MSKHVGQKCGKYADGDPDVRKTESFQYSKFQKGHNAHIIILTQIDDTQTWYVAQYIKACKRKVRKLCISFIPQFQKGRNSYKKWRKLTTLELDL